jgi:hypothetical protein
MQKVNIDEETLRCFKEFVLEKHGKIRGVLHTEAEEALNKHMGRDI